MMACHRDQPGTAHPMRLCAGWLAVVGRDHLGVRLKILAGSCPRACSTLDTTGHACTATSMKCSTTGPAPKQNGDPSRSGGGRNSRQPPPAKHHLLTSDQRLLAHMF